MKLGLPSKGRLQEQCIDWFAARGIKVARSASDREYAGRIDGIDGVELVLMSAGEIPQALGEGRIDMGVTGMDMVQEKLADWASQVTEVARLGFGRADLVIAVPNAWVDVETLDDLDGAAAAFRAVHGHRLRIATKYHRLTRAFLKDAGVADYQLVDSQGATEGTVLNQTAEAISDITTTGATLTANHLKVLKDGLTLASEAALFRSAKAKQDTGMTALLARI
jgi:ATP phosphoribosyltransferase